LLHAALAKHDIQTQFQGKVTDGDISFYITINYID